MSNKTKYRYRVRITIVKEITRIVHASSEFKAHKIAKEKIMESSLKVGKRDFDKFPYIDNID